MDIGVIRGLLTVVIFVAFMGIWVWAWSARRKPEFDASAELPLEEDEMIDNKRENI